MQQVGICASDVKYWQTGKCGRFSLTGPMIMGHEGSGLVVKTGGSVTDVKVGDRVAIEPGIACHLCPLCKTGKYNLCHQMKFCATPPVDGCLSQFYIHKAHLCFPIDNLSYEEGALVEPLAVALHTCQQGNISLGDSVCIFGLGPVGLLCLMVAKHLGAFPIMGIDISDIKTDLARNLGCNLVINIGNMPREEVIRKLTEHWSPNVCLECSGQDSSLQIAFRISKPRGTIVTVGRGSLEPTISVADVISKELSIKGLFRYANCYPKAIEMLKNGVINTSALITHRMKFSEAEEAFQICATDATAVKVIINCLE